MNNLCADIGWKSINHEGEQLCGDHVDIVEQGENSTVIVLADGLGSGVKASILSTLTSKIISTMMAEGLSLEECVSTIAATLPICSVRGVAYSTFTVIHLIDNTVAEIMQYDNPCVIMLRDGRNYDYSKTELNIDGKKKEEALSLLKKWFPQMENFSGQLKKYKVTINDLLAENEKLEARAKASEKGKMKDPMERAKLKSELDNLQRLVDRIPPEVLAELKRQQRTRGR